MQFRYRTRTTGTAENVITSSSEPQSGNAAEATDKCILLTATAAPYYYTICNTTQGCFVPLNPVQEQQLTSLLARSFFRSARLSRDALTVLLLLFPLPLLASDGREELVAIVAGGIGVTGELRPLRCTRGRPIYADRQSADGYVRADPQSEENPT